MSIGVTIVTGFLGSGKTTLLNHVLQDPALENSLVIINEFGEIGIDHLLISTPSENMRLLANGCLCCAMRGDLVETLAAAHRERTEGTIPPFDRVLVETTGLADPVPVIQTVVTDEELAGSYRLDTVLALVDCVHAHSQLDNHLEAVKQVAVADLLLLTKTDLASPGEAASVETRLREINRGGEIQRVLRGVIDTRVLFGRAVPDAAAQAAELEGWLGHANARACTLATHEHCDHEHGHASPPAHDDRVRTFAVRREEPATLQALGTWLTLIASLKGANLLRMKGIVNVEGRPVIVQVVQTLIHEPVELARWPTDDRASRVVFIVRDAGEEAFVRSLDALGMRTFASRDGLLDPSAYAKFLEIARTLS